MTNLHLAQPVSTWGSEPGSARLAVVLMHGRDQGPAFMRGVADRIDLAWVHWLAPRAEASSWYPSSFLVEQGNEPRVTHALEVVEQAVVELGRHGFGPERIALLGFSQGACVLAEHLVRGGTPTAGAVLLTGGYVGPPGHEPAPTTRLQATPVLLGSARTDALVPLSRVQETAAVLGAMGAEVTLEIYDDPDHVVSDLAVLGARSLLERLARG